MENRVSGESTCPKLNGLDISQLAILDLFKMDIANNLLNASKKNPYAKAALLLHGFMPIEQLQVVLGGAGFVPRMKAEEAAYFKNMLLEMGERIAGMPRVYEQDGKGEEAIVSLHYFKGGSDWYILEKDSETEQSQAFGYAVLNGDEDNAELGYISLVELTRLGVELDLHFNPRSLLEVKAEREHASERGRGGR